jgi:hypothetical protein
LKVQKVTKVSGRGGGGGEGGKNLSAFHVVAALAAHSREHLCGEFATSCAPLLRRHFAVGAGLGVEGYHTQALLFCGVVLPHPLRAS